MSLSRNWQQSLKTRYNDSNYQS